MTGPSMIDPSLPFIDLHRYLDGSVRLQTIWALAQRHNVKLPGATIAELRTHVQMTEPQPG
jgi:adenosine deaminase